MPPGPRAAWRCAQGLARRAAARAPTGAAPRPSHPRAHPAAAAPLAQSLEVLREAKAAAGVYTKTSIMLGLGETDDEARAAAAARARKSTKPPAQPAQPLRAARGRARARPRSAGAARAHAHDPRPTRARPARAPRRQVVDAMCDARDAGVDIFTLGQYLQPTPAHLPVAEFVPPERFDHWARFGMEEMGFRRAAGGAWGGG